MKLLIFESSAGLSELIGLYFSSRVGLPVEITSEPSEALRLLNSGSFVGLLCGSHPSRAALDEVARAWRTQWPERPLLLVGEKTYLAGPSVYQISPLRLIPQLDQLAQEFGWRAARLLDNPHPLSLGMVSSLGFCPVDLFLRLGDDNLVKLYNRNAKFTQEERSACEQKGIETFWVMGKDMALALEELSRLLVGVAEGTTEASAITDTTQILYRLIRTSGFREEIQNVVATAVEQTILMARGNPDLREYLEKILRSEHSWTLKHSMALAHISCAIAAEMKWSSRPTFFKLTIASLMHDVFVPSLEREEREWEETLKANAGKRVTDSELKAFLQHPVEAAEFLRKIRALPPDTDRIVLEHHERPEGDGFPRGHAANLISPLGCLFIFSHQVAELLMHDFEQRAKWSIAALMGKLDSERWQSGGFKKVWQAFEKTSLFPPLQKS